MKFKDFMLIAGICTNLRVYYEGKKRYSGCWEDKTFRESLRPLYDKEVHLFTTRKGTAFLGEEVGEPYIEIEVED